MFGRYEPKPHCNEETDTESWSFPSNYNRFSTVNAKPRSRLGRRVIEASSGIKRDALNSLSLGSKNGLKLEKNTSNPCPKDPSSLTHPVNSYLTPSHKRLNHLDSYKSQSKNGFETNKELVTCFRNKDSLTPFRKDIQPLKELKNFLNDQNVSPKTSLPSSLSSQVVSLIEKDSSDCSKVIEGEKSALNEAIQCEATGVEKPIDSSHSDLGNNSSFMTAHDICNIERSRVYLESLPPKTPRKGFSLLDMFVSPDPLSNLLSNIENDTSRSALLKTPGFNSLELYKTPFKYQGKRSQFSDEIFTPTLKNNSKTPTISTNDLCFNSVQNLESKPEEPFNSNGRLVSKSNDIGTSLKITLPTNENNTFSELPKPSSLVKKQIFEGLGWSFPSKSFSTHSPGLEAYTMEQNDDTVPDSCCSFSAMDVDPSSLQMSIEREVDQRSMGDKLENNNGVDCNISLNVVNDDPSSVQYEQDNCRSIVNEPNLSHVDDTHLDKLMNVDSTLEFRAKETITKTVTNDSGMGIDGTELFTVQNSLNCPLGEKDITVIPRSGELKKSQVSTIPQRSASTNKETSCSAPLVMSDSSSHPRTYPIPTPTPQTNVVYVNKKPYTVLSMLGRGGSSEVYQVLDVGTSKLMAMKFVNLASVEECIATGYLNEIEVLAKLQGCPSVIRMFDSEYIPESKILYVVMEKGDTDFSRLMKDIMKTKKISMSMIMYYWTEMLNCVKDIHEKGIIHSDLKPANFLLVSGRLKLIDFGIASSLQGDTTSVLKDITTGTFNYMSPEAIRNNGETRGYKITYKSDIWSLGCILYSLLYGRTPFSHLANTWAKFAAIADPETDVSFPSESSAPPHLLYSVRWALRKDPKKRPTAKELLQLGEITPCPTTQLGRQIASLFVEYINQEFPSCIEVELGLKKNKDKKFGLTNSA